MRLVLLFVTRALPVLVLLAAGCSGLAGEPQIIATLPPPTAQTVAFPAAPPDLALGAQLYANNCTRCHGAGGRGDGPLIGTGDGQIDPPPRDFTDPATTADQTPLDWFNIITNGRLERLMPPWRDALSNTERWAVTMYVWSLHYQPDMIAAGQQAWGGENTAASLPQTMLVQLSDDALVLAAAETAGLAEFASSLNAADRQAVAAYLRSSTVNNADVIGLAPGEIAQAATPQTTPTTAAQPVTTPETTAATPLPASTAGTISGTVTNGTAGGTVPPGLTLTLRVFDLTSADQRVEDTRETTLNADGTYTFTDVTIQAGRAYDVFTFYHDRAFGNSTVVETVTETSLSLPVSLYEITSDPGVIQITGLVTQIVAESGRIQVAQVYSFSNTSDRLFSTDETFGETSFGETRYGSVSVVVPAGAQLSGFADDQTRYIIASDGSTITDTVPVLPGDGHIFHLLYTMPYTGSLQIEHAVNHAVNGPVRLLITPTTVSVTSPQLASIGPQTLRNVTYQGYGNNLTLAAGDVIRYQLSGAAAAPTVSAPSTVVTANTLVPVVLVGGGIMIIIVGVFIYLRGRAPAAAPAAPPPADTQSLIDGLVRQIAELDDAHANGELDEPTYQKRRKRLKTRLAELMDNE